jgi:hypothetical protein
MVRWWQRIWQRRVKTVRSDRLGVEELEARRLLSGSAAPVPLPLTFEANLGQSDPQVKFLARGQGTTLFLTPGAAVLNLRQSTASDAPTATLRLQLMGAHPDPQLLGLDPLAATSNYFIGNDPSQWHTSIRNYGRVEYQGVYPGIDAIYHGTEGQLEYDFDVAPGADPSRIDLAFQGASGMTLNDQGDLVLHTTAGDVVEHAPVMYQTTPTGRQSVSGGYVLHGDGTVGFRVGAHDPSLPLVIDPVLSYASYFGGSGWDEGTAVAVDAAGAAYVTGWTNSASFPSLSAVRAPQGGYDAFVLKVNPDGSPDYFTYLGGHDHGQGTVGDDFGYGIAVDAAGNAYVTGQTQSFDFPTTPPTSPSQPYQKSTADVTYAYDVFVTKLDGNGDLANSTYLGGSADEKGTAIALDRDGNVYVTGVTNSDSTTFPAGLPGNGFQPNKKGGIFTFLAKFDNTLSQLSYFSFLGGTQSSEQVQATGLAVDASGDAYITGYTHNPFLPVRQALQPTNAGGDNDAFLVKVSTEVSGDASLVYCTYLGGASGDIATGVALDPQDNAYVVGATSSSIFPAAVGLPNLVGFQNSRVGQADGFVAKVAADGSALDYFTYLGGTENDFANAIAVDHAGNAYVTGGTTSSNFLPLVRPLTTTWFGSQAFLTVLRSDGNSAVYSTMIGSDGRLDTHEGKGIALDSNGNVWVAGSTANGLATVNASQGQYGGGFHDAFLLEVKPLSGLVQFSNPTTAVRENVGQVTLTLTRTGGSEGAVTVHYATSEGSAHAGVDYVAAAGDVTFQDGETSKMIAITIIPSNLIVGDVVLFNVILTGPGATSSMAAVSILGDTPPKTMDEVIVDCLDCRTIGVGANDVTSQVSMTLGKARFFANRQGERLRLTVRNVAGAPLKGPLWLVLDGLPPHTRLRRRAGLTLARSPYVLLNVPNLQPADSLTVTLVLGNLAGHRVHFSPRLLSSGAPCSGPSICVQ